MLITYLNHFFSEGFNKSIYCSPTFEDGRDAPHTDGALAVELA